MSASHASRAPSRALWRVIGTRARVLVAGAAAVAFLERVLIVVAAFELVGEHASVAVLLTCILAMVFFARAALRSILRVEVQALMIGALSEALLSDDAEAGQSGDSDREAALFDGLFASETLLGEHAPALLGDIPACGCMLVIACAVFPGRLVLEGAAAILLGGLALFVARRASTRSADTVWRALMPVLDELSVAIRGRAEIVASGTHELFLSELRQKTRVWRSLSTRASWVSFLSGRAPALAVGIAAGLLFVLDQGLRGSLTSGVVGRVALLASMAPPFAGVARAWLEIGRSKARIRPVAELLERETRERPPGEEPPSLPAVLSVEHVDFSYGVEGGAVIKNLVADCRPGEVLAVTGSNGSGKSTLLKLMLGMVRPARGRITVGGRDLGGLDPSSWRQGIGYLPQRPFLSDRATIREAMQVIAPGADGASLEAFLRQVELWPVLVARSNDAPLETKVGSLSAGEKQRLALARVLARRAPVLLLDEPDTNLDAEGVVWLCELVRQLAPTHMILVVAHNQRLIDSADRVLSLAGSDLRGRAATGPIETARRTA
jgi:ABC-type multidrug transport system fused ATPase/permease subunit